LSKTATSPSSVKLFALSLPSAFANSGKRFVILPALAADELHRFIALVGDYSIAVNLFLVHPTVVVERARK
jgi:hypothetical protein